MEKEKNIQKNLNGEGIEKQSQPSEINIMTSKEDEILAKQMLLEMINAGLLEMIEKLEKIAEESIRVEIDLRGKESQMRLYASERGCRWMEEIIPILTRGLKAIPLMYEGKRCTLLSKDKQN